MNLQRWNPLSVQSRRLGDDPFALLQRDMERLIDSFFQPGTGYTPAAMEGWMPAADVVETDKDVKITLDLPGLDEKDISVMVQKDVLTIKGEKKVEKDEKNERQHRVERTYGSFERSFLMPTEVDVEKAGAHFKNGVLTITVAKMPAAVAQQRKIAIKAG